MESRNKGKVNEKYPNHIGGKKENISHRQNNLGVEKPFFCHRRGQKT